MGREKPNNAIQNFDKFRVKVLSEESGNYETDTFLRNDKNKVFF